MWDGLVWGLYGAGIEGWIREIVFASDGTVMITGAIAANNELLGVAEWDGMAWRSIGPLPYEVLDAAIGLDGHLYVAVVVYSPGVGQYARVLRRDAASWAPVGEGAAAYFNPEFAVHALTAGPDGRLYIGGWVSPVSSGATNLVVWDGAQWNRLTHGLASRQSARTLEAWGEYLAIGGSFADIGPVHSPGVALLTTQTVNSSPAPEHATVQIVVAPNPTADHAVAMVQGRGEASVALYDITGRRVAVAFDGHLTGAREIELPLHDLAAGMYVVHVTTPEGRATARLLVTR